MLRVRAILVAVCSAFLCSCSQNGIADDARFIRDHCGYSTEAAANGNQDLVIPDKEISQLKNQALRGSGAAALKLASFYEFVEHNGSEGSF
jgi:hypothetical protein